MVVVVVVVVAVVLKGGREGGREGGGKGARGRGENGRRGRERGGEGGEGEGLGKGAGREGGGGTGRTKRGDKREKVDKTEKAQENRPATHVMLSEHKLAGALQPRRQADHNRVWNVQYGLATLLQVCLRNSEPNRSTVGVGVCTPCK